MKRGFKLFRWSLVLLVLAGGFLIFSNFLVYSRLTYEQPVCVIALKNLHDATYEAALQCTGRPPAKFTLNGDEWQLDARVIKWKPAHTILGFDALYRLDRIAGRYHDIDTEKGAYRTVHALSEKPSFDLWKSLQKHQDWIPGIDAMYGSGVYAPMVDGANYEITLSQTGLIARPMNDAAKKALRAWQ